MHLSHPETIPLHPWSMENLSSMKPVPSPQKPGDYCLKDYFIFKQRFKNIKSAFNFRK